MNNIIISCDKCDNKEYSPEGTTYSHENSGFEIYSDCDGVITIMCNQCGLETKIY